MIDSNSETINEIETADLLNTSSISQKHRSWKKYIILLFISLTSLANGFQEEIVPNELRQKIIDQYKISDNEINLFSYIFPVSIIIAIFFSLSLLENLGKYRFINSVKPFLTILV